MLPGKNAQINSQSSKLSNFGFLNGYDVLASHSALKIVIELLMSTLSGAF